MMYGDGWGWGGWLVMALMMIVFWGLLIAGVIALVHYTRGARQAPGPGGGPVYPPGEHGWGRGRAEEVLRERFARGEIDDDEYRRRRSVLGDDEEPK